jgi:Cu(I)/Ag(I) efflux system membrane fusion protein
MKAIKALFVFAIAITFTSFASAQTNNYKLDGPFVAIKTFKVNGTCEMCKHRIENSIESLPGVWSANWDVDSKTVVVKYDRSKTNADKIELVAANAGHDTDKYMASEEVFNKLPECCHYQRKS